MRWVFGDCVLDEERRELHRGSGSAAIEPQVFDLLVHLIRNRARVVSKDDLLNAVWQGRIVSDSALGNRIMEHLGMLEDTSLHRVSGWQRRTLHGDKKPLNPDSISRA